MAFVDGRWLTYDEREERIKLLKEIIKTYKKLADVGKISDQDIIQWEKADSELEKLQRVQRAEHDLLYFVYEYFSEDRNTGNPDNLIPIGQKMKDAADFHHELCSLLDDITRGNVSTNVAWSVGRRHAKTAYLSNAFLCHQVVYRHRKYIIEISETTDVAGDFIQWTANQLKYNQKLRNDFGELLHPRKTMNEVDNKYEFITKSGTKVEAKGIGTQMRGLRHGSTRPDLFILDDLESNANTNTEELRKKNKQWFNEELIPALSHSGIAVYMGTIVHYDSVLNYVINERKDFVSRKFPAVLSWAKREDLWEQWRKIYHSDDPNAVEKARQFYYEHEEKMLQGTKVLWPAMFPYIKLMEIRENNGAKAFNQEYLGNAVDEESQIFKLEEFHYYTDSDLKPLRLDYYCGIDFAMGKEKGDYSAIAIVGRNRDTEVCYVVDILLERIHPDVLLDKSVEMIMKYQCAGVAVEAQQAQEWFAQKLKERLRRAGYPSYTRLHEVKQRVRKALRIESLLPDIQSGNLRFNRRHRLLLEMFEYYPNHNHDDGPDAVHMAYSIAKQGRRKVIPKPAWMY